MKPISEQMTLLREIISAKQKESWDLNTESGDANSLKYERLGVDLDGLIDQYKRQNKEIKELQDHFDYSLIGKGNVISKVKFNELSHLQKIKNLLSVKSESAWKADTEEKDKEAINIDKGINQIQSVIKTIERTQRELDSFNEKTKKIGDSSLKLLSDPSSKKDMGIDFAP